MDRSAKVSPMASLFIASELRRRLDEAAGTGADLAAIGDAVCRAIAEALDADRAVYARIVPGAYAAEFEHCRNARSIRGNHPVSDFGELVREAVVRGGLRVVDDVHHHPLIQDKVHGAFDAIEISAYMSITPLVDESGLCGASVHSRVPRIWTPDEIELFEAAATHACSLVERLRPKNARRP